MGPLPRPNRLLFSLPRPFISVLAGVAILFLGLLQYRSGSELSLSLFYLVPLLLLAWYGGAVETYGGALLAALVWVLAEVGGHGYRQPLAPYWNSLVRGGLLLLVGYLTRRVRGLLKEQQALAATDGLTGLANARVFYQRLEDEALRAGRYRRPFTLAYLDLNNFRQINDSHGHATGDRVLKTVAEQLRRQVRNVDLVARLGGDEFALLLPETGYAEAGEALRKVRRALLTAMRDAEWPVTFSIGAATYASGGDDLDALVRGADDLMYQAKQAGKDRLIHRQLGGE